MAIKSTSIRPKLYCKIIGSDEYKEIGEVTEVRTELEPFSFPTFNVSLLGHAAFTGMDNMKEFLLSYEEKMQVELPKKYIINNRSYYSILE